MQIFRRIFSLLIFGPNNANISLLIKKINKQYHEKNISTITYKPKLLLVLPHKLHSISL